MACVFVCVALALSACSDALPYHARGEVVGSYAHDDTAFTQGLVFDDDTLYESTGLYGESSLRRVDLETGKVLQIERLPDQLFGEGCTVWKDTIVQLTWKAGIGFVYDKESFAVRRRFSYEGEGWGLTHDGKRLVMSDGTSYLRFLDPGTLEEVERVQVLDKGEPVERLNELEWVNGQVWANVWQTPNVVRINPKNGEVLGWIDFSELTEQEPRGVLNGIARKGRSIFVTGKKWTSIYQVEIKPAESASGTR
jgi:glutamine cyclotransferase